MARQTAFAHAEFAAKRKTARREEVVPWARLLAGNGHRPRTLFEPANVLIDSRTARS